MPKKYIPYILLGVILLIGAFLRLYRIGDYMSFLGDEGRDALIVKRIIVDGKLTLLGPITSVGLMHLGPAYYYFMAPFLWLSGLNPVGPAIMVALFSLATILLIWQLTREFFTERSALIAALLYAISPLVITYSHSSWNPNILPFWALLLVYGLLQAIVKKRYVWFLVVGVCLGVVIQLHYVALVFFPIVLATVALVKFRVPLKYYVGTAITALLVYSPFIIFEMRHQFINTHTIFQFVTRGGDAKSFGISTFFVRFWDLTVRLVWRLIIIKNAEISIVFMFLLLFGSVYLWHRFATRPRQAFAVLAVWFLVGIGVLSFYTGNIFDYYLTFIFPLPFIVTGLVLNAFLKKRWGWVIAVVMLVVISYFEISVTPIRSDPNRIAAQTQEISQFILNQTHGGPFNFALLAPGNSDHAYRYFLEIGGNPPVVIENASADPARHSVTDQLYVVCEEKVCSPLGHPLWEIAGFGRAEITDEWPVGLFKVFRLVHYSGAPIAVPTEQK